MRTTNLPQPLRFDDFNNEQAPSTGKFMTETSKVFPSLDQAMANHIQTALDKSGKKIKGKGGAAEILGIHHNTLRHRMLILGIPYCRQRKMK